MPLKTGSSQKTISSNISELHGGNTYAKTAAKFGKAKANKQAVAIALSKSREGRAFGGKVPMFKGAPVGLAYEEAAKGVANRAMGGPMDGGSFGEKMTLGPILSAVPGRTDAHATHVPSGSYVIPADIVSGRGQGNTIAGSQAIERMFKMGPYGMKRKGIGSKRQSMPRAPKPKVGFADGGDVEALEPGQTVSEGQPVRVNLAGGEVVVPPENLTQIVHPDLKTAHEIMDAWILRERKMLRDTLAKLPGPVKD